MRARDPRPDSATRPQPLSLAQVEHWGWRPSVDALSPVVLRDRVEQRIREFIDWDAWKRCQRVEDAQRASLTEVVGAWNEARR